MDIGYPNFSYYTPKQNGYVNVLNKKAENNSKKNEDEKRNKKNYEVVHNSSNETKETPLFQIFGINLYSDDILLICLIFFLYQEGVKDDGLFIALILLLLS